MRAMAAGCLFTGLVPIPPTFFRATALPRRVATHPNLPRSQEAAKWCWRWRSASTAT